MQLQRPFSSKIQSGLKFQPTKVLSKAGLDHISTVSLAMPQGAVTKFEGIENQSEGQVPPVAAPLNQQSEAMMSVMGKTGGGISQASLVFGKSVLNSNYKEVARSTIGTVDRHVGAIPVPKKYALAKKKKEKEEEKAKAEAEKEAALARGEEVKKSPAKKKKVDKTAFPDYPEAPIPPNL